MQTAARPCVSLDTHSVFALGGPTHGAAEVRPTLRRGRLHLVGSSRFSLGGFQLRREAQWQDVDSRRQVPRSLRAQVLLSSNNLELTEAGALLGKLASSFLMHNNVYPTPQMAKKLPVSAYAD
jgi:hypothetical protein